MKAKEERQQEEAFLAEEEEAKRIEWEEANKPKPRKKEVFSQVTTAAQRLPITQGLVRFTIRAKHHGYWMHLTNKIPCHLAWPRQTLFKEPVGTDFLTSKKNNLNKILFVDCRPNPKSRTEYIEIPGFMTLKQLVRERYDDPGRFNGYKRIVLADEKGMCASYYLQNQVRICALPPHDLPRALVQTVT